MQHLCQWIILWPGKKNYLDWIKMAPQQYEENYLDWIRHQIHNTATLLGHTHLW